jgi:hypothetical protein
MMPLVNAARAHSALMDLDRVGGIRQANVLLAWLEI